MTRRIKPFSNSMVSIFFLLLMMMGAAQDKESQQESKEDGPASIVRPEPGYPVEEEEPSPLKYYVDWEEFGGQPLSKHSFLRHLNAENRCKAAQFEQNRAALNHGYRIVSLEKTPEFHPWMQMFDKSKAEVDIGNRIRLLWATLYGENEATQYSIQNRSKVTMENAGYQAVRSTRDRKVCVSVQYDHGIRSTYLQRHLPSYGRVWVDPVDRAVKPGNPGYFGEPGGVYIEVFDATPIIQEITQPHQENATARPLTSGEGIIASQNYAKTVPYHEEPKKKEPQNEKPESHLEKSIEAAMKGDLGAAYLELFKMQGYNEAVTLEAYFEIESGMTYKQIKEQFGDPYTSSSVNGTIIYTWRTIIGQNLYGKRASFVYGYLRITFDDQGAVIGKSQDGLK